MCFVALFLCTFTRIIGECIREATATAKKKTKKKLGLLTFLVSLVVIVQSFIKRLEDRMNKFIFFKDRVLCADFFFFFLNLGL